MIGFGTCLGQGRKSNLKFLHQKRQTNRKSHILSQVRFLFESSAGDRLEKSRIIELIFQKKTINLTTQNNLKF